MTDPWVILVGLLVAGAVGLVSWRRSSLGRAARLDHAPVLARRAAARAALERIARRCLDGSAWYQRVASRELEALLAPGLDDETFFVRWRAVPALEKEQLIAGLDEIATDPRVSQSAIAAFDAAHPAGDGVFHGVYTVKKTSGTSGRMVFTVDTLAMQRRVAGLLLLRALLRVLWRRGAFSLLVPVARQIRVLVDRLRGQRRRWGRSSLLIFVHRGNRSVYQGATGRSLPLFARLLLAVDIVSHEEPLPSVLARAQQLDPELIYGLPSRVAWLARAQERGELRLAPVAVYVGGETLDGDLRDLFRRAWPGAAVINTYGTTETKAIAIACAECGELHLLEDIVHLELLDARGGEAASGEPAARVLATSLLNHTVPVLRYQLTDRVVPLEDAGCRVRTRRVRVEGREPAFLWLRDPRDDRWLPLDGRVLREKLLTGGSVGFMVRQPEPSRLEIDVVLEAGEDAGRARDEARRCVHETLGEHGWSHVPIEVEVAVHDPESWNRVGGKLGSITSAVKPPA